MKIRIYILLAFICISIFGAYGQTPVLQWQKAMGGSAGDIFAHMTMTADGNFIAVGLSHSNDGNVSGAHGGSDAYITKFANDGTIIWSKLYGGTGHELLYSIIQTPDGGYIGLGYTTSNDGDVSGNHGGWDVWVIKIAGDGTLQWQKCFGGTGDEQAFSIISTNDGNYLISGLTPSNDGDVQGNHGGTDGWLFEIDPSGNLLWQKCFGGTYNDDFTRVIQTIDNGFIVAGETISNDGDVSGLHNIPGSSNAEEWVVKLDATGSIQWQKCYGEAGYSVGVNQIIQAPGGGYLMVGNISNNAASTLSSGDLTNYYGNYDAWVIKINDTGTIQWQRTLGGSQFDVLNDLINTSDGGFLLVGESSSNGSSGDDWIIKLNSSGATQWQLYLGGSGNQEAESVVQVNSCEYVLAGGIAKQIPGYHGNNDAWVADIAAILIPSVSIAANPGNSICQGTPVTFTATPVNGGASPAYQWHKNGINVGSNSPIYTDNALANTDVITVTLTGNAPCATPTSANSNSVTMKVTAPVTASVSIASGAGNSICQGTPVTFTATPVNGGAAPVYQWQKNGINVGGNSPAYTDNALANNDVITVTLTGNATCVTPATANSNTVTMTVTPSVTSSVSIAPGAGNSICQGTPVTFTATPVNGGTSPVYQWQKNGINLGSNGPTYTDNALANNDVITVTLTSNASCATPVAVNSNTVTMTVTPSVTPSVSIASGAGHSICQGTPVTFTATPVNGGTAPVYQWQKNGINVGSNGPDYTDNTLANNDVITVTLTSNASCATPVAVNSNTVTMTVTPSVTPSVSIASGAGNSICQGMPVTFTATPVNGGAAPVYQWQKNGINVGSNGPAYTDNALANTDVITVTLTSNAPCTVPVMANSAPVTVTVTAPVTPSVTIASSPGGSIYQGTSVTFTAIPVNGGAFPAYQWKKNGINTGSNSSTYTDNALTNNDVITVVMTSNAFCLTQSTTTADILIKILPAQLEVIKIPNTFTPNNDGINDTWNIKSLENYGNCTVNIYSRWGAKMFSSIGYSIPWDGTSGATKAPAGVYYYVIDIKDGTKPLAGWVTLVR